MELQLGAPWPLPPVEVTATLAHKFELTGWFLLDLFSFVYNIDCFLHFFDELPSNPRNNSFMYFHSPPKGLNFKSKFYLILAGSAKIKIIFEKTSVKTTGNFSQLPPFELPKIPDAFRRSSNPGSGEFDVTYVDADTRITRGDRGELRVFVIS